MNLLTPTAQQTVEDDLVKSGLISSDQISQIKTAASHQGKPFFSMLMEQGHISDEDLAKSLAKVSNIPYVNLTRAKINVEILELLPKDVAEHYMAVPLGEMQQSLVVAMLDAGNVQAVDFLSKRIGRPLKVYAASETGIRHVIGQYKAGVSQAVTEAFEGEQDIEDLIVGQGKNKEDEAMSEESPVSKILTSILQYAGSHKASDVHIEPLENEIKIRCRIDGILQEVMKLPKNVGSPLVARVKILSSLKIDEHRIPQDGQFSIRVNNRDVDLRIAISPVVWGEQVVIRLLDKTGTSLKLEDMGYTGRALRSIRSALKRPYGMVLTSGPTGSGKSTSMYAMIQEIKTDTINIVTLEDPVEYKIEGVNQIQVNPDIGLTFATGLRSVLRQDPDVVMVGEIRDKETANLAVQAALTGHLVFSTLHTNNAAGILPRLLDMEVEPFLIASTVNCVIGQRLVRRVVPGNAYTSSAAEAASIKATLGNLLPKTKEEQAKVGQDLGFSNLPLANQSAYTLLKPNPTPDRPSGYEGRFGLYEVFEITEKVQDLIVKRATSAEIQKAAVDQGMVLMRQDGYLKALSGQTTLLEVDRVATSDA